jgi:hypothetical protein
MKLQTYDFTQPASCDLCLEEFGILDTAGKVVDAVGDAVGNAAEKVGDVIGSIFWS